jgi:hypothetical protein
VTFVQASAMVVKHVGLGKEREIEKERERTEATRAAQGEGSARRASLLVYSGLQGAFRFFTLAHFESDGQRKT